ncbi:MAG: dynamin family protein [Lamprobacter sp.]|uniref:dynamin family protein n=1 Tax=Lamprobacter sp. TaxID=3100796 RepID=UPI002B25D78B|nr:dynamin family protein [Lamprobacter sp.]MEA3640136.1 dynamin family protein [Lamprobacter sp.]
MSQSNKVEVLRCDQRVVAAKKIEKVFAGHHASMTAITRRIRHLAEAPLSVVVLGEFSAGKSSFLNRILATDALPMAILPKTATLTRLVHANQDEIGRVEIDRRGALGIETEVISHQDFAELQRAAKVHDIHVAQDLGRILEVRVFLDDPLLTKLQLVDTPGFNHDQAMDERTLGILDRADIVLWITDAVQPAKQTEFEKLRLLKAGGKRIWLIVNKADINVTDAETWEESRHSLETYFNDIGFLDFFEAKTIELISCRETGSFWDDKFAQTKARLGNEIFNLDLLWSHRLVSDEWERLRQTLEDEAERYRELERRCDAMQALTQAQARADQSLADVHAALAEPLEDLHSALWKHAQTGREAAKQGTPSMTAFVMDYTREPVVRAFQALASAYKQFIREWQAQQLSESIQLLEVVQGALPQAHADLRAEALTLRDYHRLLWQRLSESDRRLGWYGLPALDRTVEVLDHISIQFEAIQEWRFCLTIDEDDVLPVGISGTVMTLTKYRERQLRAALEQDFRAEVERIVCDPAYLNLLANLKALCNGASERQTAALTLWRDHAASPDSD